MWKVVRADEWRTWWACCSFVPSFVHPAVCLTTGPQPHPKRLLRRVRSRASAFDFPYPLVSIMSLSSCLHFLPRPPVTSFQLSFNNMFWNAVRTQDMTNPGSLPSSYFMQGIYFPLDYMWYVYFFCHSRPNWSYFSRTAFPNSQIIPIFFPKCQCLAPHKAALQI